MEQAKLKKDEDGDSNLEVEKKKEEEAFEKLVSASQKQEISKEAGGERREGEELSQMEVEESDSEVRS